MPYKASHPRVQGASLPLSTRVPRAGHFFFSSEEKVTKKTPPPTPHHARCARVVPCASRRPRAGANSRIPALGHARLSPAVACDARCGEGGGSRNPDQEQQRARLFCFGAQERAALVFPGPHCIAAAAGGNARRGGAMDRADSVVWTGTCSQRNPAADADPLGRMPKGRNALGRVSLLTFSARAEKVRRSSAGRVEALALKIKKCRTWLTAPLLAPEFVEIPNEVRQPPRGDRLAQPAHQILVVMQIVDRRQHRPEHLAAFVEMAQIGA